MAAPVIASADITPTNIKITWTALTTATETGNCTVSGYYLQYALSSSSTWTALTTTSYTLLYYSWTGPYTAATSYKFKVTAYNTVGAGTTSAEATALTDTVPGQANTPTCSASAINPTNITINWVDLTFGTATGRDYITYYKLEWYDKYQVPNVWVTVNTVVNFTLTAMHTYTFSPYIYPSGSTQTYRLSAMNGVGFGAVSANLTCTCDTEPTGMSDLTASDINPMNVTITWSELTTSANGGDIPSFYLL